MAEMRGEHNPETEEYGISSFVYQARRPFHPARFAAALGSDWPGNVLRSKGFFWLATRPEAAASWSQAGGIVRPWAGRFVVVCRASGNSGPKTRSNVPSIEANFDGDFGDARQELVFIGQHLDPAAHPRYS